VVSTQYNIPVGLTNLRRYVFPAAANPESLGQAIEKALAAPIAPLGCIDMQELQSMTWESYFERVLDCSQRASFGLN
jgi:hypothetical protein